MLEKDPFDPQEHKSKLRLLGTGAVVFASGWISNATWFGAMAFNRYAEATNKSTLLPAIALGAGTTGAEYAMTYLATAGKADVDWNPTRRLGIGLKRLCQKAPLFVTSWRGAASGVFLDTLASREITKGRRLAHAAVYGSIVGAWASEPGNTAFTGALNAGEYLVDKPAIAAGIGALALGGSIIGLRRIDIPGQPILGDENNPYDSQI